MTPGRFVSVCLKASAAQPRIHYVLSACLPLTGFGHRFISVDSAARAGQSILLTDDPSMTGPATIPLNTGEILKVYDRLTLADESKKGRYDSFGRLLSIGTDSPPLDSPILHELAQNLEQQILQTGSFECNRLKTGPVIFLSHDVDKISNRDPWVLAGKSIRAAWACAVGKPVLAKKYLQSLQLVLKHRNTYNNIARFTKMENRMGMRSTFFFLWGKKSLHGARYSFKDIQQTARSLSEDGWEIGVHINPHHAHQPDCLKRQREQMERWLGKPVSGARFHWLRINPAQSFSILEKAGFKYDASIGMHHQVGYRAGAACPFLLRNTGGSSASKLWEIPLILMDYTLLEHDRLSPEMAYQKIIQLLDQWNGKRAVISILWHSHVLEDPVFEGWGEVYEKLLQHIKDKKYPVLTGAEIIQKMEADALF